MRTELSRPYRPYSILLFGLTFAVTLTAIITAGCGSGSPPGQKLSGNTEVTVMLSSDANDQLQQFQIGFTSITLTSQSGKTVNLLSSPGQEAEFIHINGGAEALVTVSVPQDVYTAAASTNLANYEFVCATFVPPNILWTNTIGDPFGSPNNPTIHLPNPITITGDSMALSLDLLVSQSETFSSCYNAGGQYTWTFTPTFNLTPLAVSPQPTNPENGKVLGMNGEIASVDAGNNTFTISLPVPEIPETLSIGANSGTVYQGISDFSALTVGTFVNLDGALQSDGSLLATRIAVEDTAAVNVLTGPVINVNAAPPDIFMLGREEEGASFSTQQVLGALPFNVGSAVFQISGQLTNLQNLPFTPSFNGSNMVAGQNIYLTAPTIPQGGGYVAARTLTLIPQTVDGTISATSNSGSFAVYTVTLASYDLFPDMGAASGQVAYLTNPNQVDVYVDSSTQMLNSEALAVGNTLRFYGLIFNDNGTLRMDCAQVNDGVTE